MDFTHKSSVITSGKKINNFLASERVDVLSTNYRNWLALLSKKKKKKKNEEKLQGEASSSKESIHSAVSQPLGFLCVKQSGKQL